MKLTASTRVFLGLILGVMTGIGMSRFTPDTVSAASAVAQPIGKLWLNALQMTIVPLVVSLLVVGINQANDIATSGRIARKAVRQRGDERINRAAAHDGVDDAAVGQEMLAKALAGDVLHSAPRSRMSTYARRRASSDHFANASSV